MALFSASCILSRSNSYISNTIFRHALVQRHSSVLNPTVKKPSLEIDPLKVKSIRAISSRLNDTQTPPEASALIIGNEILTGKIQDTNTACLAKLLFSRGVDLVKVEVVRDEKKDIVEGIHRLRNRVKKNGFIFTSGGIGPTHDDITYDAVASAFGVKLSLHKPTVEKMKVHYASQGKELNAARLRMAYIPEGCQVLETENLWVPLAVMDNVYILPGIPSLFTKMLHAHKEIFSGPLLTSETLHTFQGEGDLAHALSKIASEFPDVLIGSYPSTNSNDKFTTRLTFEGRDVERVQAAIDLVYKNINII